MQSQIKFLEHMLKQANEEATVLKHEVAHKDLELAKVAAELRSLKSQISKLIMRAEVALTLSEADTVRNLSTQTVLKL